MVRGHQTNPRAPTLCRGALDNVSSRAACDQSPARAAPSQLRPHQSERHRAVTARSQRCASTCDGPIDLTGLCSIWFCLGILPQLPLAWLAGGAACDPIGISTFQIAKGQQHYASTSAAWMASGIKSHFGVVTTLLCLVYFLPRLVGLLAGLFAERATWPTATSALHNRKEPLKRQQQAAAAQHSKQLKQAPSLCPPYARALQQHLRHAAPPFVVRTQHHLYHHPCSLRTPPARHRRTERERKANNMASYNASASSAASISSHANSIPAISASSSSNGMSSKQQQQQQQLRQQQQNYLLQQQQQFFLQQQAQFQQQQQRSACSGGGVSRSTIDCIQGSTDGLYGMSALWPDCRDFLRNVVLGSECRSFFQLEPNCIFLNHNAYGTAVKLVLQAQAHFVNQMELNPDRFVRREAPVLLRQAATKLAGFLHAEPEDIVFVTNATTGMNAVLQSLDLQEGDEVLCLNLTYPAVLNTLRHLCYCTQEFVELKVVDIVLPLVSYDELVDQVAAAITSNTRLAVLDHIASTTGFVLPLDKLIPLFHARGIPVLVDGASAPGQLKLNLNELGADFYVGTAYKWLFGSKSCSFLHVTKAYQGTVRPVVTSLGYGQSFVEEFSIQGTRDESNFLTIVTALDFYESVGFERVYAHNKALMDWASTFLATLWRTNILLPPWQRAPFVSNVRIPVKWPESADGTPYSNEDALPLCDAIMDFLADQFRIVVRVVPFQNDFYVRISAQMYNERRDYEQLGAAILELTKSPSLVDYLSQLSL